MDPITIATILATIGGGAIVIAALWPYIVDYFSTKLIPWVREAVSDSAADAIADVIAFVDNRMTAGRSLTKSAYRTFRETLLGCKAVYEKMSSNTVRIDTTALLRKGTGELAAESVKTILEWDDLPAKIRQEMIRQNQTKGEINLKSEIEHRVRQGAQEKNMLEILQVS
jgi:hypothetical protein